MKKNAIRGFTFDQKTDILVVSIGKGDTND